MKKLMIAAAALVVGFAVQASTVSWYFGGDVVDHNYTSGTDTEPYWLASGDAYVLLLGATGAFDVAADGTVTLSGGATQITTGVAGDGMVNLTDSIVGVSGSGKEYTLLVVSVDGDNGAYYGFASATSGTFTDEDAHTAEVQFARANVAFDTGYEPLQVNQFVAAPEPTSGLLLLIGVAGLALKRRRA